MAPTLEKESLFFLKYGKMEDQLDLQMTGEAISHKTRLSMRGGLFLLSNGASNKVMEFTSYGDLLTLYYNGADNPQPILLQSIANDDRITTRSAYEYAFNELGEIATTNDNMLLIEDTVPERVAVFDEELGVNLDSIIVRFDGNGNQIDYLGQEGVGGTFFPFIKGIDVTSRGDIVVVTIAPPLSIVFWFDSQGRLIRRVDIGPNNLPRHSDYDSRPMLESVHADQERYRLYLKLNFHVPAHDPETGVEYGVNQVESRVYWLDIEDGAYDGFVDVPRTALRANSLGSVGGGDVQYELVGTAVGEHLFLLGQESLSHSQLVILKTNGRVVRRRTLELDYEETVFRQFHLSPNGILNALLATRDYVEIAWWRTDRLFDGAER